jgi:hypothetical protein
MFFMSLAIFMFIISTLHHSKNILLKNTKFKTATIIYFDELYGATEKICLLKFLNRLIISAYNVSRWVYWNNCNSKNFRKYMGLKLNLHQQFLKYYPVGLGILKQINYKNK